MCVVIVAAVPTTVIYSIYVATEAARYRCMILTIMCFTFFAGKMFSALNILMVKRWFKDGVALFKKQYIFCLFFSSVYSYWSCCVCGFGADRFLCILFRRTGHHCLIPIYMCWLYAHTRHQKQSLPPEESCKNGPHSLHPKFSLSRVPTPEIYL